jgi:hypothetical protein
MVSLRRGPSSLLPPLGLFAPRASLSTPPVYSPLLSPPLPPTRYAVTRLFLRHLCRLCCLPSCPYSTMGSPSLLPLWALPLVLPLGDCPLCCHHLACSCCYSFTPPEHPDPINSCLIGGRCFLMEGCVTRGVKIAMWHVVAMPAAP